MSFINFESGTEKEKIRVELREAREKLLAKAEFNANRRAEWELKNKLKGNDQWMLPSVMAKIDKKEKKAKNKKKSKKKKDEEKQRKTEKKRRKRRSSTSSSSSSTEEDLKERKRSKKKRKRKHSTSSSSSSSTSASEADEWVEKSTEPKAPPLQREDWLSGMSLATYSKEKEDPKKKPPNSRGDYVEYDPSKCDRELNPNWRNGNQGLPSFKRPDSDDEATSRPSTSKPSSSSGNWRKTNEKEEQKRRIEIDRRKRDSSASSSSPSDNDLPSDSEPLTTSQKLSEKPTENPQNTNKDFLTDQQINELAAKVIKAEILGDVDRIKDLSEQLERARAFRSSYKERQKTKADEERNSKGQKQINDQEEQEEVLLTRTNAKGYTRPLQAAAEAEKDKWGGRQGRKSGKKATRVETHEAGERLRFFADDDKYSLRQMFEAEKMTTSAESDSQFVKVAAKYRNKNDDLEDIFSEEAQRGGLNDAEKEERARSAAIREHQEMTRCLEHCDRCFDAKMEKQLIVSLGEHAYLSLPSHEGLQVGHCLISPVQHVSCSTMVDEEVWEEVSQFMKSLVAMFGKQGKDCIFFETVRYLHKRPHMTIHCVPSKEFEAAAFYFKKAIQESEAEWAQNRQLVDLKKEKKSLRQIIPKGLPYFWVDFGDGQGFAHVVEDQERFPGNFAQEIIGGMLGLDAHTWRRPRKEQNSIAKVKQFANWWAPYERK